MLMGPEIKSIKLDDGSKSELFESVLCVEESPDWKCNSINGVYSTGVIFSGNRATSNTVMRRKWKTKTRKSPSNGLIISERILGIDERSNCFKSRGSDWPSTTTISMVVLVWNCQRVG